MKKTEGNVWDIRKLQKAQDDANFWWKEAYNESGHEGRDYL